MRDVLDEAPDPNEKKKALRKHFEENSESICANIEDVDPYDAPKIRKHLEAKAEHDKRQEFSFYSEALVREHKHIKSVLSCRT